MLHGCYLCPLDIDSERSQFGLTTMILQAQIDGRYDVQSEKEAEITHKINKTHIAEIGLKGNLGVIAAFMKVGPQSVVTYTSELYVLESV